jgi:hypothetical protein
MDVTLLGMTINAIFLQYANAISPMDVTPAPITASSVPAE